MENEKEYISYMRKMIGHKRMMSVGLGCLIIDEKGRVLLEKRTDNGKYCLPGGSITYILKQTIMNGWPSIHNRAPKQLYNVWEKLMG